MGLGLRLVEKIIDQNIPCLDSFKRFDDVKLPSRGKQRYSHLWLVQSAVGIIGMILNGAVLHLFYNERKSLISSVNAMLA